MNEATVDVDHEQRTVVITREFDAPRDLVFESFLDPAHLTHFWGPVGSHAPVEHIVVEPRPGGRFETLMVADDGSWQMPIKAEFVEVAGPERLSFRDAGTGMLTESTFEDLGDGRTRLTIRQSDVAPFHLDGEALKGFTSSLDRFEAHLATLSPRPS